MGTSTQPHAIPLASGGHIPLLGLGTWKLSGEEGYRAIRTALDLGYRHIDTATMYGNEAEVGRALRHSGIPREEVFLTTKLPEDRVDAVDATLEESLRALGVEYVDLWLIHWPPGGSAAVPTWQRLRELRDLGRTRAIGVSNYGPDLVDELLEATGEAPAVNQVRWSPFLYDEARLNHSRARGVVLEGYSPFKASHLDSPLLAEIAQEHGVSPAQVVLRWHIEHGIVVIPKSSSADRLASNADVFGFALSSDEVERMDGMRG